MYDEGWGDPTRGVRTWNPNPYLYPPWYTPSGPTKQPGTGGMKQPGGPKMGGAPSWPSPAAGGGGAPGAGVGPTYPGGGGGGGGPAGPVAWAGGTGGYGWMPWSDWSQTPWATLDQTRGAEAQQWMNTVYPWLQAYQQGNQWGAEFGQRQQTDAWNQQFQESQFGHQQNVDRWTQGIQEQQLAENVRASNLAAYGRRWQPKAQWR